MAKHRLTRALTQLLKGKSPTLSGIQYRDEGHGYDMFGMHPDYIAFGEALGSFLYDHYFRVSSYGAEKIPDTSQAILAANHSGSLPTDAMMLWMDVVRQSKPTRVPRPVADYFVSSLPWVSTLYSRCGVVTGSRGNVRALLEGGNLMMIFPEGVPGVGKPFKDRYQLQEWRKGHCELAIRHSAPVIPVAIIGAEEQMPQIGRIPVPKSIDLPYIPVTATPLPMPVHYHIYYGDPLRFDQEFRPEDADDPDIVAAAAARVKAAVQTMLLEGLEKREGVFK